MKVSYNWLKEFVDFEQSPEEIADLLTRIGLNVEEIIPKGGEWSEVYVGKVISCEPVPDSNHLSLCQVDYGSESNPSVVCGALNVAKDQLVPLAVVGAELPGGFKITERKLRGVLSQGMICSEKELGLSDEAAGIMVLPTECEIGKPLEEYIGKPDWILDIEVTINRGDWLSHLGVAREISAATELPLKMPAYQLNEGSIPTSEQVAITIENPDSCPRYTARVINNVKVGASPLWMQERLRMLNVRPISNVVDVTNYVMLELGHPLHAFDRHLVTDGQIIVRNAEHGERFTTLDNKEHQLHSNDLLIADPKRGIALAGVMGGENSEIKDDTRDVLLECAYFEPVGIRVTSRNLNIDTDSSARFSRGADPEMTVFAVNRAASLINELAGGELMKGAVDEYPKKWNTTELQLRPERVNHLLGTGIEALQMVKYLKGLGCEAESGNGISVNAPSWRHDLEREIDLVEEAARLYGYDKIDSELISRVPLEYDKKREKEQGNIAMLKTWLVEFGLYESINPTLVPLGDIEKLSDGINPVKLISPLSEDMAYLRTSLKPSLLRAVERNCRVGVNDIRLFEFGKVFEFEDKHVRERSQVGVIFTGGVRPEYWQESVPRFDLYELKGMVSQFLDKLSLDKYEILPYDISNLKESFKVRREGVALDLCFGGRINQDITSAFNIDTDVYYAQFDGDQLLEIMGIPDVYSPLPKFPGLLRDLAFIVPKTTQNAVIESLINRRGGDNLVSIELFDHYHGKGIPQDSKSLAYRLTFRNDNRTLNDSDVDPIIDKIVSTIQAELNAVLRSKEN